MTRSRTPDPTRSKDDVGHPVEKWWRNAFRLLHGGRGGHSAGREPGSAFSLAQRRGDDDGAACVAGGGGAPRGGQGGESAETPQNRKMPRARMPGDALERADRPEHRPRRAGTAGAAAAGVSGRHRLAVGGAAPRAGRPVPRRLLRDRPAPGDGRPDRAASIRARSMSRKRLSRRLKRRAQGAMTSCACPATGSRAVLRTNEPNAQRDRAKVSRAPCQKARHSLALENDLGSCFLCAASSDLPCVRSIPAPGGELPRPL